jgi:AraC-like DNA-binding protein
MTLAVQILANGTGWQASDVRCGAGPADAPYEEQHGRVCMAVVLDGTFGYRSSRGTSILAPGAILLGNPGDCFECGHQHSVGDRCLSFHLDPEFYESVIADVQGATRLNFDSPALPPDSQRAHLLPRADAALDDLSAIEEFAYELAASVAAPNIVRPPNGPLLVSNAKRIQEIVHWIEKEAHRPQSLAGLARQACMSPYHFLREFKRAVGTSPHQFVLAQRLRRAASKLRHSDDPVLSIAVESGFSDLSEFNRRFRRVLGVTPRAFRKHGPGRAP